MRLHRLTDPSASPTPAVVTVAEARQHLGIEGTDSDTHLAALIPAAVLWAEGYTGRALLTQRWRLTLDGFPRSSGRFGTGTPIELPLGRCQYVSSISYRDGAGAWQTLTGPTASPPGTDYEEDLSGVTCGILTPSLNESWPDTIVLPNSVRIDAAYGYGSTGSTIPADIRQAVLCRLADLYETRGPGDESWTKAAEALLAGYRLWTLL